MAYTKDYYHILGLDAPGWGRSSVNQHQQQQHGNSTAAIDLRRAYKAALLAAHPDKKRSSNRGNNNNTTTTTAQRGYTIDDIKEAYTTLSEPKSRAEYENWYLHHGRDTLSLLSSSSSSTAADVQREKAENADFVLGLEVLDLSEFDTSVVTGPQQQQDDDEEEEEEEEECMQWTRACRCGAEKGFLILQEELEDADRRGEKEVLVGCEGCSLWVRVGFDVEEG